jgi:hypothetical protein
MSQEARTTPAPGQHEPRWAERPRVVLWLSSEWNERLKELLDQDHFLRSRLVTANADDPLPPRCLVVVDEATIDHALSADSDVQKRHLPVIVLLDPITVSEIDRVFRTKHLNIKGFYSKRDLEIALAELGRLARVLIEELRLLAGEEDLDDDYLPLQRMIARAEEQEIDKVVSLFIDGKMRQFLYDLGQILEGVEASGLQAVARRFWKEHDSGALQTLFGEIGQYLKPDSREQLKRPSRERPRPESVWDSLSDPSEDLLRAITRRPRELPSMPRLHILMQGETGTGKTLIARWIHQHLGVKGFQHLNITAIPEKLLESELFGSVSGAYTDAVDRPGALLEAYGGVIFLDEIGDMPLELQSKLLVYLDQGAFRPLGWLSGVGEVIAPCLVVAATNRPLQEKVRRGEFREDLYHRFLYKLSVPPLRQRRRDLPLLVDLILQDPRINKGARISGISYRALWALELHPFNGNFRELEDLLGRACALASREGSKLIQEKHLYRAIMDLEGMLA